MNFHSYFIRWLSKMQKMCKTIYTKGFKMQLYWSKVLTDQPGLCRFFRKHKIVKDLKTATLKQVFIYLSKLLKFIFRKSHYVTFSVKKKKESTQPKYAPSISQLLITCILCIGHSNHTFFHWFWMEKKGWFASLWGLFVLQFISDIFLSKSKRFRFPPV